MGQELNEPVAQVQDIKNCLKAAEEKAERLEAMLNSLPEWVYEADNKGNITYSNNGIEMMMGYTSREVLGKTPFDFIIYPEEINKMRKIYQDAVDQKAPLRNVENKSLRKDGSIAFLELSGDPFFYPDGSVRGYKGVVRDITERKNFEDEIKNKNNQLETALIDLESLNKELFLAQEELLSSEIKYRSIINGTNEIIGVICDAKIKFINVTAESILGFSADEMLNKTIHDIIFAEDMDFVMNYYAARMNGESVSQQYDARMVTKKGNIIWTRVNASFFQWEGQNASLVFVSDITDRKKVESRLEQTRAMLQAVLLQSPIGIGIVSLPDMNVRLVNDKLLGLHGTERREGKVSLEELNRIKDWLEFDTDNRLIEIDDLPLLKAMKGFSTANREIINQHSNGDRRTVLSSGTPVYDRQGNHIAAILVEMDITERKIIEEKLRNQNDELTATNEELVALNEEFEAMNEELVQSQVQLENAHEKYKRLNEELEQRVKERTEELFQSMDTLKRAQDHLVQAEKMASLGELVAGVAHEINTPLGVGVTAASFLRDRAFELGQGYKKGTLKKSDFESFISAAEESTSALLINLERAADLIQSFKQVSVDQSSEKMRRINLKDYVDEVLLSLHSRYKRTGHSIQVICPQKLEIVSYPGVIFQIISNLVMNSLLHGFENIDSGIITMEFSQKERSVLFVYTDNGKGMSAYNLKRIFNPFHTTRRGKGGTGLGMHIVFNLVTQKLGGTINCWSEEGKGTRFDIIVPISIDNKNA